jgi:hypothetical protein
MMRRYLIACVSWLALISSALVAMVSAAEAPAEADPPDTLQFRRIFAPADRIGQWPLDGEAYLPIEASEFQRLVEAAHQNAASAPGIEGLQLAAAEYRARLVDDVLQGEAALTVVGRPTTGVLLSLEPLGLAIARATWEGQSSPAAMGRSENGRVGVLVEKPGKLMLSWSLRGERGPHGELVFPFELPHCATNRLVLELPKELVPSADRGMVEAAMAAAAGRKEWRIELGGSNRSVVRLAPAGATLQQPPALLRQSVSYEFSPRGVEVTAQLHFDAQGQPPRQLAIELDPRLRLVAARSADRDIPWTAAKSAAGTRVVLDLPDPVALGGRTVRLSALAALEERTLWPLPQLIVEGVAWLEGTLILVVPKPLVLDRVDTEGCRQLKASPLAAPLSGESLEFQCFRPDAGLEVVLTRPTERLHVDTGSIVEMGVAGISCRAVSEISLRQDEQFTVSADLGPDWFIDAVEAGERAAIADWQVDSNGGAGQRLIVALKQSVSARQPLTLSINGHRREAPSDGLGLRELEMLHFSQADVGRNWIAVRAADAHELVIKGGSDLTRVDPKQLTTAEARLFLPEVPAGLIFAVDPAAERLQIGTVQRKPTYTGEINVDVVADAKTLTETYTLRCASPSARVERVLLYCSQARPEPLRFSVAGGSGGQITARRLAPDDQAAQGSSKAGEAWELTLRLPRTGPFEVRAVRTIPFEGLLPLSLASLPEASSQRGTVAVRALGETGIRIENHGLRLIPAELTEAEFYPTTRGTYRYEPQRDVASAEPVISVHPTTSPANEAGAWVWQSQLESRFALRDATVHLATWHVQTRGRSHLTFSLPPGAELRGVTIDNSPLSEALIGGFGSDFSVDLPPGKQFATVSLSYLADGRLPRLAGSLTPAWPEVDVPVLARRWKIWLPPGYELTGSPAGWEGPAVKPPTWSQRLFGPLGRASWQTAFHPLRVSDWFGLIGSREEVGARNVERFNEALGEIVGSHSDDLEPLDWGRLSELLASAAALSDFEILVDREALERIGLRADSVVPNGGGTAEARIGKTILDRAELFLLYNDQTVVLTTAAAMTGNVDTLPSDRGRLTGWLGPGPLEDEVAESATGGSSARYVPLAIWSRLSAGPDVPWRHESAGTAGAWATRGWRVYAIGVGSQLDRSVSIVRPAAMQSCAWAVFLLGLAIGLWRRPVKRQWLIVAAAFLAAIALVGPITFLPLTSAGFLAALCALAWSTVERRQPSAVADRSARSLTVGFAAPALLLFSLGLALSAAVQSWADEPAAPGSDLRAGDKGQLGRDGKSVTTTMTPTGAPSLGDPDVDEKTQDETTQTPSTVHRVFVPVDADNRPVGAKVYVPEQWFQQLSRRASNANQQPGDWLLTRVGYQVLLSRENAQQTVTVAECKAIFDLEVFRPRTELVIPLGGEVTIVRGSAKLDGRPINIDSHGAVDHLSCVADQAGLVRLEVGLTPEIRSDGGTASIDIPAPAVPISTLAVSVVGDPVTVDVLGARGQVTHTSTTGFVQAELGPSGHLAISWPEDRRAAAVHANVEVEELLWVKLQAGAPLIDARFKCRALEGHVRRLRILADPRLQLLPATSGNSNITAVHATPSDPASPGEPVVLDLDLVDSADQANHEVTVDLTFLVTSASGIGNFRLPRLEATAVRSGKRLLAVTLDPALYHEEQLGDDIKSQTSADFLAAWGPASREPQLVFSIPQGSVALPLARRPAEIHNVVEQLTICSFGQGTANVHCGATLTTSGGHNFQLRLTGPPGLEIQNISLIEGNVQRVARWATDDAGAITVFLTGAVSGRQQFALEGRLPAPIVGDVTLTGFQWRDAELKKNQVDVFRQPATLIGMAETIGASSVEVAVEERLKPEWGRLVASYTLDDPRARLNVHLAPNQPQTEGRQVLIVDRDRDAWNATIDLQLHVRQGLIDILRFDVPPQWVGPYQFNQDVRWEILTIPSENRRQLVIRPVAPIAGDFSLRVRGQLIPSMGDRLGVADLAAHGLGPLERFVVLPQRWEQEQVVWDTTGLALVQLPSDLSKRLALRKGGVRTFRVVGDHFHASLKGIEHSPGKPHVRLADIQYVWQADGNYYGVCAFDLTLASDSSAILNLPPEMSLVSVAVADLPTPVVLTGERRWRFALGPPQLPQHIEVVFRGTLPRGQASFGPLQAEAPILEGLQVDETLWTIYGPPGAAPGELVDADPATAARLELARLEATKSVLGLADHVASEQMPEEMDHWRALWKARFLAARGRVQRLMLSSNQVADRQELEAWMRDEVEIGTRLEIASVATPVKSRPEFEPLELLAAGVATDPSVVSCRFTGSAPAVIVRYAQPSPSDFGWRLTGSLLLCGMGLALLWKRPLDVEIWLSAARLLALVGAGWWLWLTPSFVGFAILLATLAGLLITRLRSARPNRATTLPTG